MRNFQKDIGLLIMRLCFGGVMFYAHGLPKLTNYSQLSTGFADPIGVGPLLSLWLVLFAEVLCALALVAGFFTRWAAVPLAMTMGVAFFIVHAADPFSRKELAFLFLAAYVVIYLVGPGRYSVDGLRGKA